MSLNPPPLKIMRSHALSGSFTVAPKLICVAPTATTNEHDAGNPGLNLTALKPLSFMPKVVSHSLGSDCSRNALTARVLANAIEPRDSVIPRAGQNSCTH